MFDERKKEDELAMFGLINYCDSSYTIICVPNQSLNKSRQGCKNGDSFEIVINSQYTVVIPMKIGTIFTYSGYPLTH